MGWVVAHKILVTARVQNPLTLFSLDFRPGTWTRACQSRNVFGPNKLNETYEKDVKDVFVYFVDTYLVSLEEIMKRGPLCFDRICKKSTNPKYFLKD